MLLSRRAILATALALPAASGTAPAWGEDAASYPSRPVRMIVGFAAGGGNDLFARLIGQKLSENMGQPVVIENRPGAGGRLAVEYAMVQGADGYTLVSAQPARWRLHRPSIRRCRTIRPGHLRRSP